METKTVLVSGGSSYRGWLDVNFAIVMVNSYWFFRTSVILQCKFILFYQKRYHNYDLYDKELSFRYINANQIALVLILASV